MCSGAVKIRGEGTAELQLGIEGDKITNDAELELGGPKSGVLPSLLTVAAGIRTSRSAGLLIRLLLGGVPASPHRRGRERNEWGGCDPADGAPAACIAA